MFVVSGEALFDVFAGQPTASGFALEGRIGGSPFNVAVGLARLGQPAAYFGSLSRDVFGNRLLARLVEEKVSTESIRRTDAPTTLSIVGVDEHGVPSYTFHGQHGADRDLPASSLAALPENALAFHFGSYSMLVEPVASTLRALVEAQHGRRLVAYDPNVRLNVEPSLDRWRAILSWMATRTHLLKVSEEDLGMLYPGSTLDALASAWLKGGVPLVVVTRGGQGAIAWTAKQRVSRVAKKIEVVDTVGAGDSFHAALLTWLAERKRLAPAALSSLSESDLGSMLDFASFAAAITCSRRGAQLPLRSELNSG